MFGLLIATPTFWGNDGNESIWPFHKVIVTNWGDYFPITHHGPKSSTGCFLQCPILAGKASKVMWFGLVGFFVCLCHQSFNIWMIVSINGFNISMIYVLFLQPFYDSSDLICKQSRLTWKQSHVVASSNLMPILCDKKLDRFIGEKSRCRWTNSSTSYPVTVTPKWTVRTSHLAESQQETHLNQPSIFRKC